MANAASTGVPDDEPQLGPKATKIRERIRNITNEDDDKVVSREDSAVVHANQSGQRFTAAMHGHERSLRGLVKQGCTMVGNVEVAAVSGEVAAVVDSETRRDTWRDALENDHKKTRQALKKMQEAWELSTDFCIPEDLHESLCQLREWSEELTQQKVAVIEGLREELRELDAIYSREALQHARERVELLRRITEHVTELHQSYRTSLRAVQEVADTERKELVVHYSDVWDEAVRELNQQLHRLLHERLHNRTSRMDEIIELKLHGAAPHTAIKDQLDADIEKVLVELMRVKAGQQMEESQLRYNQQVLQQQYRETTALVSEGRRTLNALRPSLNSSRRKAEEADCRRLTREQNVVREVKRVKELIQQYKDRLGNTTTFYTQQARGLSLMHYEAMHQLVMEIVEMDRGIQHGVLAREWVEPDLSALSDLCPALSPADTPALAAASRILAPSSEGSVTGSDADTGTVDEDFLTRLAEEAAFLVSGDISQMRHHGPLLLLEHVFWELGIHTENDVSRLLKLARRHLASRPPPPQPPQRQREDAQADGYDAEADEGISEFEGIFTSEDVLAVLVAFCSSRKDGGVGKEADGSEALEPHYAGEKEESGRWNSFLQAFGRRTRAWTAIRHALSQYLHVLEGRLDETRKVERLRRENAELRHLLQGVTLDL
ncbi:uncharacterized protein LOC125045122 [Penaeus chinensis]|uniref:uncharacterized protein LOC125045122 n=1 Tax=Penaeus chinensis TaxID=139456 RepID=UPI001FB68556|nr:uncharacterized protein LOC125045122 [Penaeus chinensis]